MHVGAMSKAECTKLLKKLQAAAYKPAASRRRDIGALPRLAGGLSGHQRDYKYMYEESGISSFYTVTRAQ